jgi:acetyl-CoA synthetase
MTIESTSDSVWHPSEEYLQRSRVLRLMRRHGIESYDDFYQRSITDLPWFWEAVTRDELSLEWSQPYQHVLDLSDGPAWPRWFVNGRINYVVNAVDRHARDQPDKVAIRFEGEDRDLPADGSGDRDSHAGYFTHRRDLHPDLLRVRGGGGRGAPA